MIIISKAISISHNLTFLSFHALNEAKAALTDDPGKWPAWKTQNVPISLYTWSPVPVVPLTTPPPIPFTVR